MAGMKRKSTVRSPAKKSRSGAGTIDMWDRKRAKQAGKQSVHSAARSITPLYRAHHLSTYPQRMYTTLSYLTSGSTTVAASTFVDVFRAQVNNAYSPFSAGSCIGYSTLIAPYTKCFVRAVRIRWYLTSIIDGGTVNPFTFGITTNTESTALGGYNGAVGEGISCYKQMAANPDTGFVEQKLDISRFFSAPNLLDNTAYASTSAASPTQVVYSHCWIYAISSAANYDYTAEVQMDCVFCDPIGISA